MGTGGKPADDGVAAAHGGVRAGVAIHGTEGCPVVAASTVHDGPITGVNWTHVGDTHTEEFRARDPDAVDRAEGVPTPTSVVDLGDERVYRYDRPRDGACACRIIEELDCPIADARAEDGVLLLTLHLPDLERLRDIVSALDGTAERVEVRYLVEGSARGDEVSDRTLVDRGRLTDRQCEVLRTAYRMGYFERPRDANASAVADALDISPSTFAEHLATAQRKLLEETLAEN
ncbi:helix-turn-helix domain-containing protein [Halorubrum ezzemoulense]|uniref:Helix-turn-helix domain-containing protein n=1 Tax=Halorubrum ezzemoulense TaxID=337243 RepID=A0A256IZV6_HALEZ|nr:MULTISPECIES: helix-turn-helix domain-containing protein [Halorubrum]MDB2245107.1 helix-turn-helix domain-containing protein [Halorubrum ezzemoulense]MDB2252593.1 helix-turn-helix domain-containing protein [Halorubrum ezzemoulense]MDB2259368.1 helix-turn-helix domain-containing protein [Halorubrum ezzemoulense]MDB2263621.1 helix-turn-helix domain-containing protein [Halorubrum ezzemoulense]MDB2266186.1 helix-turn-helix domain-containing protein [Halorubrum ezzemoulense]